MPTGNSPNGTVSQNSKQFEWGSLRELKAGEKLGAFAVLSAAINEFR